MLNDLILFIIFSVYTHILLNVQVSEIGSIQQVATVIFNQSFTHILYILFTLLSFMDIITHINKNLFVMGHYIIWSLFHLSQFDVKNFLQVSSVLAISRGPARTCLIPHIMVTLTRNAYFFCCIPFHCDITKIVGIFLRF